jgi:hypothetical protein
MDIIRELIGRVRRLGFIVLVGFIAIGYISLALVYWQQTNQQNTLDKNILQQSVVLSKPLPSGDQLKADYNKVSDNSSYLASITNGKAAFAKIVEIATKNGINSDAAAGRLNIPGLSVSNVSIGGSTFGVLSFRGIRVQADNASVMAFLSDIDLGKTLETMVLKRVSISYVKVPFTPEEVAQRAEYVAVTAAVKSMMLDNNLSKIPAPQNYAGGKATNLMGDDPATTGITEGFPDANTTSIEKGYTGLVFLRSGYVLFQHDKVLADTGTFAVVNYLNTLRTKYYYTVEADGTVRQFSGPDVATATEYHSENGQIIDAIAVIDVDIYVNRFQVE